MPPSLSGAAVPVVSGGGGGGGGGGSILFASDWSTALGTSVNAVGDGGLWPITGPMSEDILEALPATGFDFPATMANVLAIRYKTDTARGVQIVGGWPPPAIGQSHTRRFYFRSSITDNGRGETPIPNNSTHHPIGSGTGPDLAAFALIHNVGFDRCWIAITGRVLPAFADYYRFGLPGLAVNQTYRVEVKYTRLSTTTFNLSIRVYNAANALIIQDSQVTGVEGYAPLGGVTLADVPTLYMDEANMNALGGAIISQQGHYLQTNDAANRIYFGGFAVGADWLGPYTLGERTA